MQGLNEKHRAPYRLKQVRLANLCAEACRHEFGLIIQEQFVDITDAFVSSNSDFWWEPVTQESYDAVVASVVAKFVSLH